MDKFINIIEDTDRLMDNLSQAMPSFGQRNFMDSIQQPGFWVNLLFNLLIIVVALGALKGILSEINHYLMEKRLQAEGREMRTRKDESILMRSKIVRDLHGTLTFTLTQKNMLARRDGIFYAIITIIGATSVLFVFFRQYLLGLIVPYFLLHYVLKILESMEISDVDYMHVQLPVAIDEVLKSLTKYGDLKNVFFEASLTLPYPIRREFETLARRMNSRSSEEVLLEFKDKYEDIWVNSFVFILISMLDDSEKELGLDNLRKLRDMLTDENNLKNASVSEKRLSVNTNYALAGVAAAVGLGMALFTEFGSRFFFSTPLGLFCFIGGYALVFATIKINVGLVSTKEKE